MKPIAKILVPVTGAERDRAALLTAFEVARLFGAHVEALLAHPDPRAAVPQVGVPFTLDVVDAIVGGQESCAKAAEADVRKTLARLGREMDVRLVDAPDGTGSATYSLRNDCGPLATVASRRARLSDLVIFPPLRLPGFVDVQETFLNVLTDAERPVLVSVEQPSGRLARSVAVAWDASRSAAHAVSAALPFLSGAERVLVLEVRPPHSPPGDDGIEQYLKLHGINCVRKALALDAVSVGDMLAEEAASRGADLLVMGGYGHSHLRETLFGGATSDVLARARMPVFLAH